MNAFKHFGLKTKLVLLLLIPLITILFLSSVQIAEDIQDKKSLSLDKNLIEISVNLADIVEVLQKERSASYIYLVAKDESFYNYLQQKYPETDRALADAEGELKALFQEASLDHYDKDVAAVLVKAKGLLQFRALVSEGKTTPALAEDYYDALIDEILALLTQVRNASNRVDIANEMEAYISLSHYINTRSLRRTYVARLLLPEEQPKEILDQLKAVHQMAKDEVKKFFSFASPESQSFFLQTIDVKSAENIEDIIQKVIEGSPPPGLNSMEWLDVSRGSLQAVRNAQRQLGMNLIDYIEQLNKDATFSLYMSCLLSLGVIILTLLFSRFVSGLILEPVQKLNAGMKHVLEGNLDTRIEQITHDEIGDLVLAFNQMVVGLQSKTNEIERRNWVKDNVVRVVNVAQSAPSLEILAREVIKYLVETVEAGSGAFYILKQETDPVYTLTGTYAPIRSAATCGRR